MRQYSNAIQGLPGLGTDVTCHGEISPSGGLKVGMGSFTSRHKHHLGKKFPVWVGCFSLFCAGIRLPDTLLSACPDFKAEYYDHLTN